MTRYALARPTVEDGLQYVAASYGRTGLGVVFTPLRADACTYVTIEKVMSVFQALQGEHFPDLVVVPMEEA